MISEENKVFIITGAQGEGKTNKLIEVTDLLQERGIKMKGFVAKGYWTDKLRSGFDLQDVNSGESKILSRNKFMESFIKIGRFYFNPETIKHGEDILNFRNISIKELMVIDEIGLFEIRGKIWSEALLNVLKYKSNPLLITVRANFVEDVISHFKLINPSIFHLSNSASEIAKEIHDTIVGQ